MMDLEPVRIYIDTVHRLPSNGHGLRPVIVKFVPKLDRDLVWSRKDMLSRTGSTIYIQEHFDEATEKNIRKLLSIRKKVMGKKV